MRAFVLSCLSLVVVLVSPAVAQSSEVQIAPAGAWVAPPPPDREPEDAQGGVRFLMFDTQTLMGADFQATHNRMRYRIESAEGLASGQVQMQWDPKTSGLTVHHLRLERGDETIDVLASQEFRVLQQESLMGMAMLTGFQTAFVEVEGLRVGDVLDASWTVEGVDPVVGSDGMMMIAPRLDVAGQPSRYRVAWPSTVSPTIEIEGDLPGFAEDDDGQYKSISTDLFEADFDELPFSTPARFAFTPRFSVSTFADWADVASRVAPVFAEKAVIERGSDLDRMVRQIRKDHRRDRDRAAAALALVQDEVRYLYDGFSHGGLTPLSAEEAWRRRYGDCKAKTVLLVAMLHSLGIEATPLAVSSNAGAAVPLYLPGIGGFDHVIVMAEIDGERLFMDGAAANTGGLEADLSTYAWGLPLAAGAAGLVPIEGPSLDTPLRDIRVEIDGSEELFGDLPITVTATLRGGPRALMLVPELPDSQLTDRFSGVLAGLAMGRLAFDAVTVSDGDGEATVTATGTVQLRSFGRGKARGWTVPGGEFGFQSSALGEAPHRRTVPIAIGKGWDQTEVRLRLPSDGFAFRGENVDVTVGGSTVRRAVEITGDLLVLKATNRHLEDEIPAARAGDYATLLERANETDPWFAAIDYQSDEESLPEKIARLGRGELEDIDDRRARGQAYLDLANYGEAAADFTAIIDEGAAVARDFAHRGMARTRLGETDAAQADFLDALAADPGDAVALHGLGVLRMQQNAVAEAEDFFTQALESWPADRFALNWRLRARARQGKFAEALEDADRSLTLTPGSWDIRAQRAMLLVELDRLDEAAGEVDGLVDTMPETVPAKMMVAGILFALERYDEAVPLNEAALATAEAERVPGMHNNLCWRLATEGVRLEKAEEHCEKALALSPDQGAFLDSMGLLKMRQGDFVSASEHYAAALSAEDEHHHARYGLGLARLALGDAAGAEDLAAAMAGMPSLAEDYTSYGFPPPAATP